MRDLTGEASDPWHFESGDGRPVSWTREDGGLAMTATPIQGLRAMTHMIEAAIRFWLFPDFRGR